jgi:hypothetical protein
MRKCIRGPRLLRAVHTSLQRQCMVWGRSMGCSNLGCSFPRIMYCRCTCMHGSGVKERRYRPPSLHAYIEQKTASRFHYGKHGMHYIVCMRDGRYGFYETHDHFDHFISEHFFSAQSPHISNDHTYLLTLPHFNDHSTRTTMALHTSIACDNAKYQCTVSLNFHLALSRRNIDSVLGSPV